MDHQLIPLASLRSHPRNSNVMAPAAFEKLLRHIERSGRYPPVIVRPLPQPAPEATDPRIHHAAPNHESRITDHEPLLPNHESRITKHDTVFQILDGHHRVEALRQLGHTQANCVIWDVDDAEALLLLGTLNRLQGQDDPRKRAALVAELSALSRATLADLAAQLPEEVADLEKLLVLAQPPPAPAPPPDLSDLPVAVHFFLLPRQRDRLEERLRQGPGPRETTLLKLLGVADEAAEGDSPPSTQKSQRVL